MADNLSPTSTLFALPDHGVVSMAGADALTFAQAQFCNDLSALATGQWQWNAWLNAKGRVIALFAVLRPAEDELWLLLPDYPPELLAGQLSRFVFRRKVKVSARPELVVAGAFAQPLQAADNQLARGDAGVELDLGSSAAPRRLVVSAHAAATPDAAAVARWRAADLAHGLPRLAEAQREQWTPQQLALERLPAYSVKKGCYPGQEIVARTHFLGKAKRSLMLLEAGSVVEPGATIEEDGSAVGQVASTAPFEGGCLLLAVLPLEHPGSGLSANGVALRPQPLREGLAR